MLNIAFGDFVATHHKHHIIPKYMGGTDDESNLILLTVEEHAKAHKDLYEKYGNKESYVVPDKHIRTEQRKQ